MLRPHCALHSCNVAHTQSATFELHSERIASKSRLDPIFFPWLIKYGGKSGFSLSDSVGIDELLAISSRYDIMNYLLSAVDGVLMIYLLSAVDGVLN